MIEEKLDREVAQIRSDEVIGATYHFDLFFLKEKIEAKILLV